ncbi:MAG: putative CoA-binding protein [Cyanobacteria bacterium RYN_339]|nr:putative CoA-binding protein [Cyanobacteria bacterium RYN_339]
MSGNIEEFVGLRRWAVVGVSDDKAKFGRRIFESLRGAGYDVVPVHPSLNVLDDGTPVFKRIGDIPQAPDVVDLVIPPAATAQVIEDCIAAGVTRVWFQPGAEAEEAISRAEQAGLAVIAHGPCAMVEKKRWA